jgi:CubicO group peptidase (beta-lactamase class C family)
MTLNLQGFAAPGFEPVRDEFIANFSRQDAYQEVGASLAVYRGGDCIIDLSAGLADRQGQKPWTRDTLANVWSTTKGVTAIAVAMLVDQGLIDYAAPVARYWPQFAQNGKEAITVSQLLSHQAGLPGFTEPTRLEDFYNWPAIIERLERQAPMWPPGTQNSYHAMSYGFLAGELVRRASGMSVGEFVAKQMAGPLGADVFIGLPLSEEPRVSPLIAPRNEAVFDPDAMTPSAIAAISNPAMEPLIPNDRAWRAAEVPAGNGHATALGLARLYAAVANGGTLNGVKLMSPDTVTAMSTTQTTRPDLMLGIAPFWRNGFAGGEPGLFGPHPHVFGHSGWGGSFGCADAEAKISIGYVMNQMGDGIVGDPRATSLCHTIYACL